jgi:hypothetical protein
MVLPRLRSKGGNNLYLPHACAYETEDTEYKGNSKKLEKRLRFVLYRFLGPKHPKAKGNTIFAVVLIAACFMLKTIFVGLYSFRTSSPFPWKYMSRPANDAKPKPKFASKIYTIPDSMSTLGDKSNFYAELRKAYDTRFPANENRSLEAVENLQNFDIEAFHPMELRDKKTY